MTVPQTDTGRQVEDTKVNERPFVKELCKMTPYLRKKECLGACKRDEAAVKRLRRLFTKNLGLCKCESIRIGADACPVLEG